MSTLIGLLAVVLTALVALPGQAVAWNIPGHMLSGSIACQVLRRESAYTVEAARAILESLPWQKGARGQISMTQLSYLHRWLKGSKGQALRKREVRRTRSFFIGDHLVVLC